MTNDELDRIKRMEHNMEFIAEHQARFEAQRQQTEEQQRRTEANLDRLTVKHAALADVVMNLATSHVELVNSHKQLAEAQKRVADAQVHTDERLDAFISFVEKYLSSRNGGQQPTV